MKIILKQIPKESIKEIWPKIEPWVKNALGKDKSFFPEDVKAACLGQLTLWVIFNGEKLTGFLVTSLNKSPQGITAYAPWLGGENLGEWVKEGFKQLLVWLKEQGCIQFSWIGRKAWKKLIKADSEQSFYLMTL